MKNLKNKAVGLLMTTAMLASALLPTACSLKDAKDTEKIQEVCQQFFEAYSKGSKKDLNEFVESSFDYEIVQDKSARILLEAASKTEIKSFRSVEINRENNTAKARLEINYVDLYEFYSDCVSDNPYLTEAQYIEALDCYKDLEDKNLTLSFEYDNEENRWVIKKASAEKYEDLFERSYLIKAVQITSEEAIDGVINIYTGLAGGQTEFTDPVYSFDTLSVRVFDDGDGYSDTINEAAEEFTKAYFEYITDRGLSVEPVNGYPYEFSIEGNVPSSVEILSYFSSDEHLIEVAMAEIRSQYCSVDGVWEDMYAGIYYDLAKRISDMKPEEYSAIASVDPWAEHPEITFSTELFPISIYDVVWASDVSEDQMNKCRKKAAKSLYLAGEITEAVYKEYIASLENNPSRNTTTTTGYYGSDAKSVFWEGTANYTNQAVNVVEEVPSWSTDGSIVYGTSMPDANGIYMHYTKEPGWEDTAGYCLDTKGIVVMVRFDHRFSKGTVLEYDWYINENQYGETQKITVSEDGTVEFEFLLEGVKIPADGSVSFRLWEEGHSHVISYVVLTQT